jgi:GNAT superfamily N-acetyltransferase
MEILQATSADVDEIVRLEHASRVKSAPNGTEPTNLYLPQELVLPARALRLRNYMTGRASPRWARQERIVFKVCVDGSIVGYIAGHLTTRHGMDAEIQSLYVLRDYQRAGIGRRLLLQFTEWAIQHEVKTICAGIDPNRDPSFYLKYGGRYVNPCWVYWPDTHALANTIREIQRKRIM